MQLSKDFHSNRFGSIQTLRGLAAIFVVLEHIRFLNCGAFGVDIFFCISGFMIMYTTEKTTEHFFRKRLIRIVPFYYLMTIGTYLLLLLFPGMFQQTTAQPSYLLKSLLFIPFDIGGGVLQPLLRIGWTINCEMLFYLLFFLSFHISHKYRGVVSSLFLMGIVLLSELLPVSWTPLEFYGNPVMLEFAFGILCYYIAQQIYRFCQTKAAVGSLSGGYRLAGWCCLLLGLGGLLLLALTKPYVNIQSWRRLLYWGLPALVIVLVFFTAGLAINMPKWGVWLGDISFSLYFIHYYPILLIDRKLCDFSVYSPTAFIGAIIGILLTILLAFIAWYIMENRFTRWLQQILS